MKLQPDRSDAPTISGYGPGWVGVDGQKFTQSVVVASDGQNRPWACAAFAELTEDHFNTLSQGQPELVIFGSGARLRFAPPALLRGLMAQRIGVETMDTLAACRTYNILAAEGRKVVAALLIEA